MAGGGYGKFQPEPDFWQLFDDDRDYHRRPCPIGALADAMASPSRLQRPCLAAVGHLLVGNGSACCSGQIQEAHSTVGLCGWHVRCAAFHRLRRRFCSAATTAAATTTTARNAVRNLHDHNDCYQFQFKRTAGKYAHHVDRQVMAGWKKNVGTHGTFS